MEVSIPTGVGGQVLPFAFQEAKHKTCSRERGSSNIL